MPTKDQLIEYATEQGIIVDRRMRKSEIEAKLADHQAKLKADYEEAEREREAEARAKAEAEAEAKALEVDADDPGVPAQPEAPAKPQVRRYRVVYGCTIPGDDEGEMAIGSIVPPYAMPHTIKRLLELGAIEAI